MTETFEPVVAVKEVCMRYNGKKVLENVTLEIIKGETLAIIGQSGCGKTTLLRCLIGLISPTSGRILVFGKNIFSLKEADLNQLRERMGMVFQEGALFDSLSVFENVAFPLRHHRKMKEPEIKKQVKEFLSLVGLEAAEHLLPSQLSGGMQRRVGIARALVMNPELVLYDEPTTGLDPVMTNTISDLMLQLKRKLDVSSVLVTHDMETAFKVADRVGMLYDGKLIEQASPQEMQNSTNQIVVNFIGGKKLL